MRAAVGHRHAYGRDPAAAELLLVGQIETAAATAQRQAVLGAKPDALGDEAAEPELQALLARAAIMLRARIGEAVHARAGRRRHGRRAHAAVLVRVAIAQRVRDLGREAAPEPARDRGVEAQIGALLRRCLCIEGRLLLAAVDAVAQAGIDEKAGQRALRLPVRAKAPAVGIGAVADIVRRVRITRAGRHPDLGEQQQRQRRARARAPVGRAIEHRAEGKLDVADAALRTRAAGRVGGIADRSARARLRVADARAGIPEPRGHERNRIRLEQRQMPVEVERQPRFRKAVAGAIGRRDRGLAFAVFAEDLVARVVGQGSIERQPREHREIAPRGKRLRRGGRRAEAQREQARRQQSIMDHAAVLKSDGGVPAR